MRPGFFMMVVLTVSNIANPQNQGAMFSLTANEFGSQCENNVQNYFP
jgi:hypothetical protein